MLRLLGGCAEVTTGRPVCVERFRGGCPGCDVFCVDCEGEGDACGCGHCWSDSPRLLRYAGFIGATRGRLDTAPAIAANVTVTPLTRPSYGPHVVLVLPSRDPKYRVREKELPPEGEHDYGTAGSAPTTGRGSARSEERFSG